MKKMFLIDLAVCAAVLLSAIAFISETPKCSMSCTSKKEIKCKAGESDQEARESTMPIQWFKY